MVINGYLYSAHFYAWTTDDVLSAWHVQGLFICLLIIVTHI